MQDLLNNIYQFGEQSPQGTMIWLFSHFMNFMGYPLNDMSAWLYNYISLMVVSTVFGTFGLMFDVKKFKFEFRNVHHHLGWAFLVGVFNPITLPIVLITISLTVLGSLFNGLRWFIMKFILIVALCLDKSIEFVKETIRIQKNKYNQKKRSKYTKTS